MSGKTFNTDEMEQQEQNVDMSMPAAYGSGGAEGEESAMGEGGEGEEEEEQPYDAAQDVGYRGEFKPELVQLLAKLRQGQQGEETQASGEPISPEALKELLEKSVEIEIDQVSEGEIANSASMFVDNLMGTDRAGPAGARQGSKRRYLTARRRSTPSRRCKDLLI